MRSFFESTRGQIVALLRRGFRTVEDLSRQLGLTDNAVRAHLDALVRDGLVERRGVRPALRKPHFTYALTDEAEHLFPKSYHRLLIHLLSALKMRLPDRQTDEILAGAARSLADELAPAAGEESLENRIERALAALEAVGGAARPVESDEGLLIAGTDGCPFSALVAAHPEVCGMVGLFLSEVTGLAVTEQCRRGESPQCVFMIGEAGRS